MAGEVVHDNDVPSLELGSQELPDESQKTGTIDRPFEHHGGRDAGSADGRDHRGGFPMACGHGIEKPLASLRSAGEPFHVGLGSAFIQKDKPIDWHFRHPSPPSSASTFHVGTILFGGPEGLFL